MRIALLTVPRSERGISVRKRQGGFLPPVGLATIAAILQREGHQILLLDAWGSGLGTTDVIEQMRQLSPQILGLSFSTPQAPLAAALAERFKQVFQDALVIAGGPHVTSKPGEILESTESIDIEIIGEADLILPEMVSYLERGEDISGIPNTLTRGEEGIIHGAKRREDFNIDGLPFPQRTLLDLSLYCPEPHESLSPRSTSMIATRGCSYSLCTFCLRSGPFRRIYRAQSVKRTLAEIEMLYTKYGITEIQFHDDDLFSHRSWIEEFTDEILSRESLPPFTWFARGRPSAIGRDTLEKAREAGLYGLEIGFESGNQETLDLMKKGITLEESRQVVSWARELGVMIVGNFILGFPNESPRMGEDTIRFARDIDPDFAIFIPLHPEPGTKMHTLASSAGTFVGKTYNNQEKGSHRSRFIPSVSYVPERYDSALQLGRQIRRAFLQFYLRPSKVWHFTRGIRSPSDIRRYIEGLGYFRRVLA